MPNELQPLTWNVSIVDPQTGFPTNEFMRKWAQQQEQNGSIPANASQVSTLLDKLGNTRGALLERGSSGWTVIVPGTAKRVLVDNGTGNDPSYSTLTALLDSVFGSTQGSILYRDSGAWKALGPGSAGQFLQSGGAGANPSWASGGGGGGYNPGTPPSIVQVASATSSVNSITFATAPTAGNLLVSLNVNSGSGSAGSGWTLAVQNTSGLDWGSVCTKVAGAGESATQSPMASSTTSGGGVIWELHGAVTPTFFSGASEGEGSGTVTSGIVQLPCVKDCLALAFCGATVAYSTVVNVGNSDVLDNTGNRKISAGHCDLADQPIAGIMAKFSTSGSYKRVTALVSS